VVPPECLGELGWLAVADTSRNLPHSQAIVRKELSGLSHSHGCEVIPECGFPDFRESALKLSTRGSNALSNVVQLKIMAVLGLD